MDYVEAFQNLRTNNKYGRKSHHKAVMMLTVIQLYEQNELTDNEIVYDDSLKTMFVQVWNSVLPDEPLFHPEAYMPFWYLQSDSFWHIVPKRGKEDILSLMRDTNIKPSESKLYDCVKYAELDDDLYFLMTLPSGRSSLKRVLLETYTNLSEWQIDRMTESVDNTIDYSASALSDYEKILSNEKDTKNIVSVETDNELVRQFQSLNEDIQIVLNLQYYSFLKSHRNEREMFKDICPTVYDLYDKIIHPIQQAGITPSFAFTYDNFLSDLKIALMSEEGSMDLIDKIGDAVDILRGNISNVGITEPIVETKTIEPPVNDIEESSHNEEDDAFTKEYFIENKTNRCYIIDNRGKRVFSSEGQLIRLNKSFYKINYTDSLVSMMIIQEDSNGVFSIGRRILSAHSRSPLYAILDKQNYLMQFKAIKYDVNCDEYNIQVDNRWYGSSGYYADLNEDDRSKMASIVDDEHSTEIVIPKFADVEIEHVYVDSRGKIVDKVVTNSYEDPQKEITLENRKGKTWTKEEENIITSYFHQGKDTSIIADLIGRTEVAVKSRLAKLGLIEYTYGQEDIIPTAEKTGKEKLDEGEFDIENSFTRCYIIDKNGEKVFSTSGRFKFVNGKIYRLKLKKECFHVKNMRYNGNIWVLGEKKIVAYPGTELYRIMDFAIDICDNIEDIVDEPMFENCKLKVNGVWYNYKGERSIDIEDESQIQNSDKLRIIKNPLYSVRKQALLRAMGFFRLPAKLKDIVRTISRTAWGNTIKEEDVEDMIKTMSEVESVDGKYILRKR